MEIKNITIIGPGRLGTAFQVVFSEVGFVVKMIDKTTDRQEVGDVTFITVPDGSIHEVSKKLASGGSSFSGKIVAHCSGAYSSQILDNLAEQGALTACFHPLKAVSKTTRSFKASFFDLEGSEEAIVHLEDIVKKIGAQSIRVSPEEKELLHVSAVMASNYTVTLADLALRISSSNNISERELLDALLPLMGSSIENLSGLNPAEALTGPIARGDIQTVQKHLLLLQDKPDLLAIYKHLGLLTLELITDEVTEHTIKFRLYDLLK
ncbi:MAG: DUF2520 domain-containing protein [Balneola sp.]|nr:MAG: DUF2520 domain-containing protein [Balneola sp.]